MFIPTILLLILVVSLKESRNFLFSLIGSMFETFLYLVAHLSFYILYALIALGVVGGSYAIGKSVVSSDFLVAPSSFDIFFALLLVALGITFLTIKRRPGSDSV